MKHALRQAVAPAAVEWVGLHSPVRCGATSAMVRRVRPTRRRSRRRGFSLQEAMIAIGVLGIGLVMVATVFPVALASHRRSVQAAAAVSMAGQAQAVLRSKVPTAALWRPATDGTLPPGQDSPWILIPHWNIDAVGGAWDIPTTTIRPLAYTNHINNRSDLMALNLPATPVVANQFYIHKSDMLSDARPPLDDTQAEESPFRLVWFGFYRERAGGEIEFAAVVCRQTRGEQFVVQDLKTDPVNAFLMPMTHGLLPNAAFRRFPVPWRVSVTRVCGRLLENPFGVMPPEVSLAALAPIGSKLIVSGWTTPIDTPVASGRVLTVTNVDPASNTIEVLEDVSDLPGRACGFVYNNEPTFDVWVIPPAVRGETFDDESPVMEWVFF